MERFWSIWEQPSDPRLIYIHPIARFVLVQMIFAPTRTPKSAHAYQHIWTVRGSPLLFHSQDLVHKLSDTLGQIWNLVLGIRYGQPSIASALQKLQSCERIIVPPLYSQYASASTGTAIENSIH